MSKVTLRCLKCGLLLYILIVILVGISFIVQHTSKTYVHSSHTTIQALTPRESLFTPGSCSYPPSYMKPLYNRQLQTYQQVQLVFYKKMKMSIAVEVCRKRGWMVPRIAHTLSELTSLLSTDSFTILFTSSKELSSPLLKGFTNNSNILAAGIPNAFYFTGAKREQHTTFQRYLQQHDCSIEGLKFMPTSYLMDDVHQCRSFQRQLELTHSPPMWVLKKSQGYGGDGVTIVSNVTALKHMFNACPSDRQYILQEYVHNMLLLNGRKFDVRALVLIANTKPYMLFYHDGYLRVVMTQYDSTGDREVHLTNTHVQSTQSNFDPNSHFWSFGKFQTYLDKHHPKNNEFVAKRLVPYIKDVALLILKSGNHSVVTTAVFLVGLKVVM